MLRYHPDMHRQLTLLGESIASWWRGWFHYVERRLHQFGSWFEKNKSIIVDILMMRRGSYRWPFLHTSIAVIFVIGIMSAPILAHAYPGGIPNQLKEFTPPSAVATSLDLTDYGIQTQVSEKPRDQVISYKVESGDTLSKIAERFSVTVDTIRWANNLTDDDLSVGQNIKIPPVSGIVHKVKEGETIYSIAKKYRVDPQKIANFPYNDFVDLETFALNVGQTLVVPDGIMPEAPAPIATMPPPPVLTNGSGQLMWPTAGIITQYPIWYHLALDIANSSMPAIMAADNGVVSLVQFQSFGYGRHAMIDHGGGIVTLYGHMSEIYIHPGDKVSRGQVIGRMGSTGNSTGTHLHFEVRKNGVLQNPLGYLGK
jgi:murein DD-endopeptidase MepM/ murein hydrolase activator NlpD